MAAAFALLQLPEQLQLLLEEGMPRRQRQAFHYVEQVLVYRLGPVTPA